MMAEQKTKIVVEGVDNASGVLKGVGGQLETLKTRFEAGGPAVNKLKNSMEDMAKGALGLQGSVGRLGTSLLAFGPRGAVIGAAVAGLGLLISKINEQRDAQEKLRIETEAARVLRNQEIAEQAQSALGLDALQKQIDARKTLNDLGEEYLKLGEKENQLSSNFANFLTRAAQRGQILDPKATEIAANLVNTQITQINKQQSEILKVADRLKIVISDVDISAAAQAVTNLRQLGSVTSLTAEQTTELADATNYLTRIFRDQEQAENLRIKAGQALGMFTKETKQATVDLGKVERDRLTDLYALQAVNQLGANDLVELNTLERQYTATLNNGTLSIDTRADALKALAPMFKKIADEQKAAEITGQEFTAGLITQINELRKFSEDALSATISIVGRAGGSAGSQDIMFLEDRLKELQLQLLTTANTIDQNQIEQKIQAIQGAIDSTFVTNETAFNNLTMFGNIAADSFELLFSVIGQGGKAMAAFGVGFTRMLAQMAKSKAAENLAFAIENFAKAAGFIALGNAPSSAAAKTAAIGHLKAAGAWGALAGAGIAGSNAIAGNNGGAGSFAGFSQSGVGGTQLENQGNVTIVFPDGLIDLSNPTTQREFSKLIKQVAGNRQLTTTVGVA